MAENPIVTDEGWSCTITAGSASVALIGILGPATGAAAGDFLLDAAGVPLALEAVGDTTYTLARPAAASSAGTMQLKWMRGPHRSLAALSTQKTVDVYTRQQIAMNDGRSQAVIAWQNDPPGTPAHADRYLVKVGTGAWAAKDGKFAEYNTSGTPGWLFTSPRAGDRASINGSRVRLEFDGTSWGPAAVVSSATTVGRLARFTDTAGGLGQSQMAEDGSGNVTAVGSVASGSGVGSARMVPGDAARSGYLAFYNAAGTRQGYIGDVAAGLISLYAEAGNAWSVTGNVGFGISPSYRVHVKGSSDTYHAIIAGLTKGIRFWTDTAGSIIEGVDHTGIGSFQPLAIGGSQLDIKISGTNVGGWNSAGDLALQRSNSGGAVQHSIYNTATGAAAVARLFLQTGTANSTLNFQINDNSGSPYVVEQGGSAITAKYTDYDQHLWRSKAGVQWMQLVGGDLKLSKATQATVDIERTGGMVVSLVTTAPSLDGLRITTYAQPTTFENIVDYYSNGANRGAINGWHRFFATTTASAGPAFEIRHTDVRSNLKFRLTGGEGSQLEIAGATKTWGLNVANATGEAYFQNVTDSRFPFTIDAAAPTHSLRIQSAKVTLGLPLELKAYTLGTLPSAAAHSGETVRVIDGASNKQIVTSDGSVWRYTDGVSV